MTVASVTRALMRRWYVTVFGLIITAVLCSFAMQKVPATYSASGDILLLPPEGPKGANPYLNLGGVAGVTDVVSRAMSDNRTTEGLNREGVTGTYTVQTDENMGGPAILVTGKGKTSEEALHTLRLVMARVPPTLQTLQEAPPLNVPQVSLITATTLQTDVKPKVQSKNQTRALIGAAGVGLLLTVLLAVLTDVVLTRRSRPKTNETAVGENGTRYGAQRRRAIDDRDAANLDPERVPAGSFTTASPAVRAAMPPRLRRTGRKKPARPRA